MAWGLYPHGCSYWSESYSCSPPVASTTNQRTENGICTTRQDNHRCLMVISQGIWDGFPDAQKSCPNAYKHVYGVPSLPTWLAASTLSAYLSHDCGTLGAVGSEFLGSHSCSFCVIVFGGSSRLFDRLDRILTGGLDSGELLRKVP
jgi:hypothetical protein